MKNVFFAIITIIFLFQVPGFSKEYYQVGYLNNIKNNTHLIEISKGKKYGAATPDGKLVIPVKYSEIRTGRGVLLAKKKEKVTVFSFDGNVLISPMYEDINAIGDYLIVKKDDKYGLVDKNNNSILPIKYTSISPRYYNINEYLLNENNKISYYKDGNIIDLPYENAAFFKFDNKNIVVEEHGKKGIYDIEVNNLIIPIEYDEISEISTLLKVKKNNLYTLYNEQGKIIVSNVDDILYQNYPNTNFLSIKNNDKKSLYDVKNDKFIISNSDFITSKFNGKGGMEIFYTQNGQKGTVIYDTNTLTLNEFKPEIENSDKKISLVNYNNSGSAISQNVNKQVKKEAFLSPKINKKNKIRKIGGFMQDLVMTPIAACLFGIYWTHGFIEDVKYKFSNKKYKKIYVIE